MSASLLAEDLSMENLPDWIREAALTRLDGAGRKARRRNSIVSWELLASMAIDESLTPAGHRSLLRVIITFPAGSSWPVATFAHRSGLSVASTKRALADLEEWGWIVRHRSPGRTSRYRLMVPVEQPPDRLRHHAEPRNKSGKKQSVSSTTEVTVTPPDGKTDRNTEVTVTPPTEVTVTPPEVTVTPHPGHSELQGTKAPRFEAGTTARAAGKMSPEQIRQTLASAIDEGRHQLADERSKLTMHEAS